MYFSTKHFNLLRQNEVLMRQLILFLKRKMDAFLRPQTLFASTNSLANQPIRGLPLLGLI